MEHIPGEGSRAGDIFAVMVVLAPVVSLLLASLIKPRAAAFFLAIIGSGCVIGGGFWLAGTGEQVAGLAAGGLVFGGWAGILSLFFALVISVGRGFITSPVVESAAESETTG
jgi:hypothetical protein